MKGFVETQTGKLLRKLSREVERAAENPDEEGVHDLRVAIRRLNRCLRVFSEVYPGASWKKIRRKLKVLMDAAGEVRDRDIAATLLTDSGVKPGAPVLLRLAKERQQAADELASELRDWSRRNVEKKWHADLGL